MRTIFVMSIENTIDLITNSSSELFVLRGNTKNAIMQMLDDINPEWVSEYEEPKNILELDVDELNVYFSYACSVGFWPAKKSDYPVLEGFTFDELYEEFGEDGHEWDGEIRYELRNNKQTDKKWDRDFVTEDNRNDIINKHNPEHNMWFLFSKGDNPDWGFQEKLMEIADRFHLG